MIQCEFNMTTEGDFVGQQQTTMKDNNIVATTNNKHELALSRFYWTDGYAVLSHIRHKFHIPKISATDVKKDIMRRYRLLHQPAGFRFRYGTSVWRREPRRPPAQHSHTVCTKPTGDEDVRVSGMIRNFGAVAPNEVYKDLQVCKKCYIFASRNQM